MSKNRVTHGGIVRVGRSVIGILLRSSMQYQHLYKMDERSLAKLIDNILDNKLNPVLKTLDELKYKINKIDKIEESIERLSA
jgi:hypothetical protein